MFFLNNELHMVMCVNVIKWDGDYFLVNINKNKEKSDKISVQE